MKQDKVKELGWLGSVPGPCPCPRRPSYIPSLNSVTSILFLRPRRGVTRICHSRLTGRQASGLRQQNSPGLMNKDFDPMEVVKLETQRGLMCMSIKAEPDYTAEYINKTNSLRRCGGPKRRPFSRWLLLGQRGSTMMQRCDRAVAWQDREMHRVRALRARIRRHKKPHSGDQESTAEAQGPQAEGGEDLGHHGWPRRVGSVRLHVVASGVFVCASPCVARPRLVTAAHRTKCIHGLEAWRLCSFFSSMDVAARFLRCAFLHAGLKILTIIVVRRTSASGTTEFTEHRPSPLEDPIVCCVWAAIQKLLDLLPN